MTEAWTVWCVFSPVSSSVQSGASQDGVQWTLMCPCPRIHVRAYFGTVPITASSAACNTEVYATSFHGKQKHDKYQKSAATHEMPWLQLRVMIMNHFCILRTKPFTPLGPQTGLKQCQSVIIRRRHLAEIKPHLCKGVAEGGHVYRQLANGTSRHAGVCEVRSRRESKDASNVASWGLKRSWQLKDTEQNSQDKCQARTGGLTEVTEKETTKRDTQQTFVSTLRDARWNRLEHFYDKVSSHRLHAGGEQSILTARLDKDKLTEVTQEDFLFL